MINVQNVSFTYPKGQKKALTNVDFQIEKGEIFGFLGPSGSGKSTMQKILYQWLKGYEGNIQIEGKDLKKWGRNFYEKIGVCFELPNHYNKLSGLENLQFFAGFYHQKVDALQWLKRVGLGAAAKQKVSDYSKGMKMRLNFIRGLLHDPDIIFMDEPTSGLDPGYASVLKDIIRECRQASKTIFLTTHNMHDASELCDRVAFLADGEIKAIDSPDNFKQQYGKHSVKVETQSEQGIEQYEFELQGLRQNEAFLSVLEKPLVSLHSSEATLESVFIEVTGKPLTTG